MAPTTSDIRTETTPDTKTDPKAEATTDPAPSACKDTHTTSATTTFERLKLIQRGKEVLGYGQMPCAAKAEIEAEVVKDIKTKLNTVMGSKLDASSGDYTYQMDSTVLAFQRKYDLAPNRYIGRQTLGKLEEEYSRITNKEPSTVASPASPAVLTPTSAATTPTAATSQEVVLPPKPASTATPAVPVPTAQPPQEQRQPTPSGAQSASPDGTTPKNADQQRPEPRNATPGAVTTPPAPTNDPIATAHADLDHAIEYSKTRIKSYSDRIDAIIKQREDAGFIQSAVDSSLMSGFRQSAADKELIMINNGLKRLDENLKMLESAKDDFGKQLKSDLPAQEKEQLATQRSNFAKDVVRDDIEWRRNANAELANAHKSDQQFAAKAAVVLDATETVGQIAQVGLAVTGVGAIARAAKLGGPLRFFAKKGNTEQSAEQATGQSPGRGAGENAKQNTDPTTSPENLTECSTIRAHGHEMSLKTYKQPGGTTYRVAEVESAQVFRLMLKEFRSAIMPGTLDKIAWKIPGKP